MKLRMFGLTSVFILCFALIIGCVNNNSDHHTDSELIHEEIVEQPNVKVPNSDESNQEQPIDEEPKPYTTKATLIAVGDIMTHMPQISGAYDKATDTYVFDSYFTEIKHYLEGDWVIGNLETPLAGKEAGYSGYPQFNAPSSLADALKHAGFNILTTANNHALDRREPGLLRTLDVLRERELIAVGTHASQEEADDITIVTKNDIAMAILSYTYGTNGIPIPEDKPYLVNLIDEEHIAEQIRKAREKGAELVTVALHMEGEYHRMPNERQKQLTQAVIEAGADIILGSHPHVVQPYEIVETIDENGIPKQAVIIYSLGNFISNQGPPRTAKYTDVGVVFNIEIMKHFPEETIEIGIVQATSTWVHRYSEAGKNQYRILPIEATLANKNDELKADPLLQQQHYELLEAYYEEMEQHIAAFMSH